MASQSAAGFSASAPAIPKHRVVATTAPSVRALCASSEIAGSANAGIARDDEQSRPAFASAFPALEDLV